ncbi:MAG: hypothetical protein PHS44_01025 [Candidatus Dojkabacteria bacterium]|nr:hypothetical protein [Candidatus Dojkabacteria bacterium]
MSKESLPSLNEFLTYARDTVTTVRGELTIETVSGHQRLSYALTERNILAVDTTELSGEDISRALNQLFSLPEIPQSSMVMYLRIDI